MQGMNTMPNESWQMHDRIPSPACTRARPARAGGDPNPDGEFVPVAHGKARLGPYTQTADMGSHANETNTM